MNTRRLQTHRSASLDFHPANHDRVAAGVDGRICGGVPPGRFLVRSRVRDCRPFGRSRPAGWGVELAAAGLLENLDPYIEKDKKIDDCEKLLFDPGTWRRSWLPLDKIARRKGYAITRS